MKRDEAMGMTWWNGLPEVERAAWLEHAGSAVPADAWREFKARAAGRAKAAIRRGVEGLWLDLEAQTARRGLDGAL
jgi:hypothetical protein